MGGAAAALGFVDQKAADAAPAAPAGSFQPARHEQDNWFDELPGAHRVLFDTWTAARFSEGLMFAGNIYRANRDGYGLTEKDLAVIICVRHNTAPFAFNDAMWAKYGVTMAERANGFVDPKTKQAPTSNIYMTAGYGEEPANAAPLLGALLTRGVRLAVCSLATRGAATAIAKKSGAKVDDVFKELTEHLVPNARMVPAGIVAVSRAQERGYTFSYVA